MTKKDALAKHSGTLPPTFAEKDLSYYLRTLKTDFSEMSETQPLKLTPSSSHKNVVILITAKTMGRADEKLGDVLMQKFLAALAQNKIKPKAIILINEAVYLAKTDSPCITFLTALLEQEVSILLCEATLKEKNLETQMRIGTAASMQIICDNLLTAWKVVTI